MLVEAKKQQISLAPTENWTIVKIIWKSRGVSRNWVMHRNGLSPNALAKSAVLYGGSISNMKWMRWSDGSATSAMHCCHFNGINELRVIRVARANATHIISWNAIAASDIASASQCNSVAAMAATCPFPFSVAFNLLTFVHRNQQVNRPSYSVSGGGKEPWSDCSTANIQTNNNNNSSSNAQLSHNISRDMRNSPNRATPLLIRQCGPLKLAEFQMEKHNFPPEQPWTHFNQESN